MPEKLQQQRSSEPAPEWQRQPEQQQSQAQKSEKRVELARQAVMDAIRQGNFEEGAPSELEPRRGEYLGDGDRVPETRPQPTPEHQPGNYFEPINRSLDEHRAKAHAAISEVIHSEEEGVPY